MRGRKLCLALPLVILLCGLVASSCSAEQPLYKDPQAPIQQRVEDLLKRMTLQEKIAQLGGDRTGMSTPENTRLGIPGFKMSDGPYGVRWDKSTCFPTLLAAGATFDPAMVERMGVDLGQEFRGKGRYVALGPCINVIRDPRGGRSFETFGEDPYLIGQLAAAYVRGEQSQKVVSVVKHFDCNNQEDGRGVNDVRVGERVLHEVYLAGFRAAVEQGGALGIMAAYNKVNGTYCAANHHILTDILKDSWGFKGFVVSDWGACHSTVGSINGGLDVEMPTANFFGKPLLDAVKSGAVSEQTIDDAVRRVLYTKFWAGVFEKPVVPDESKVNTPAHQALCLDMAREAMVLLKNKGGLLPLDASKIKSIAVIGPNAAVARPCGGGSSQINPYFAVSPLEGLQSKVGKGVRVDYLQGCMLTGNENMMPVPASALRPPAAAGAAGKQGLLGDYFANQDLQGKPKLTRVDPQVNFDWGGGAPADGMPVDHFSVCWTGTLVPTKTGSYVLGTTSDDGVRLYLNGKLLIDQWHDQGATSYSARAQLEAGHEYQIKIEYYENTGLAVARLTWAPPNQEANPFAAVRALARKDDVAIVCVGDGPSIESEGKDRETLDLPGLQDELVQAVASSNPHTIVAMVSGSAMLMDKWISRVPAVIQVWFPGEEEGNALADLLFGDADPSGRLPVTFPASEAQLPPFDNNYETIAEGRGYRYYEGAGIKPQFPFGYGLSYTTFRYGPASVTPAQVSPTGTTRVTFRITNAGRRAGTAVPQLYVHAIAPLVPWPVKRLEGFHRVELKPGQSATVTFDVTPQDLAYWDTEQKAFVTAPGRYELQVGKSSADIQSRVTLRVR